MYVADSVGYLGYAAVLVIRTNYDTLGAVLPFFEVLLIVVAGGSVLGLLLAQRYFRVSMTSPIPIATDNQD